jgi:hypothetical protein
MEHPVLRSILILFYLRPGLLNGLLYSGLSTEMHFTSLPCMPHSPCFGTKFGALHCVDFFGLKLFIPLLSPLILSVFGHPQSEFLS